MSRAPLLLLILPLVLLLAQLWLRKYLRERSLLRQHLTNYRPPSPELLPWATEVDLASHPLFHAAAFLAPLDAEPYYLIFDTETQDAIHEETTEGAEGQLPSPSPVISLAWQVLDASGRLIREEYHLLRQAGRITAEATALHGLRTEDLEREGKTPSLVLQRFLRDAGRSSCLVAHHLRFHQAMLLSELEGAGLPTEALTHLDGYCTMEAGRVLGFKRRSTGEALYPRLGELFGHLYYQRPHLALRYREKGLRDVRLSAACLRALRQLPSYRSPDSLLLEEK